MMDNRSTSESGKLYISICMYIDRQSSSVECNILDLLDKECDFIHEKFMMALDDFMQAEKRRF